MFLDVFFLVFLHITIFILNIFSFTLTIFNFFVCIIFLVMCRLFCIFATKITSMAIKILSAKEFAIKLKATIQASGKLGFTAETAKVLDLESGKYAKFAKDDESNALYLIINNERSEDAFDIRFTSGYYYVATKVMFDTLGYKYENGNIMFDLVRQPSLDDDLQGQVYFMKQRPTKNKEKKNDIISEP